MAKMVSPNSARAGAAVVHQAKPAVVDDFFGIGQGAGFVVAVVADTGHEGL